MHFNVEKTIGNGCAFSIINISSLLSAIYIFYPSIFAMTITYACDCIGTFAGLHFIINHKKRASTMQLSILITCWCDVISIIHLHFIIINNDMHIMVDGLMKIFHHYLFVIYNKNNESQTSPNLYIHANVICFWILRHSIRFSVCKLWFAKLVWICIKLSVEYCMWTGWIL